jgi:exopolysaccharide biosynthesis polyprenyl glycosylphosphotransferase
VSTRYRRLVAWITALTDIPLINLAFALAYWLRYELQWFRAVDEAYYVSYNAYVPVALGLTAIMLVVLKAEKAHEYSRGKGWLNEFYAILNGTTTSIMIMVFITFFLQPQYNSRLIFIYAAILIILMLGLARLARGIIIGWLRRYGIGVDRMLIVGAGELGRNVMANLVAQPALGYEVVGYVDDNPDKGQAELGRFKGLGGTERIPQLLQDLAINDVIITLPWMYHRKILAILGQCERAGVRARIVPDLFEMRMTQVELDDLNGIPLLSMRGTTISGWNLLIKRAMDVTLALLALVILSPVLLLTAIAIKLDSPGPVLFRQKRVGKGGREFYIYKFRSMRQDAEQYLSELEQHNEAKGPLFKIRDDPRCTAVGKFIRRTSIDELPQFYNVLRGEMSLVGPRPPLPREVDRYQPWHRRRLEVAPGITGLPQVSGRSNLTFDEMAFLDLYYIQNWSPALDTMILLRTLPNVLLGRGAF